MSDNKKKSSLGRGLAALLEDANEPNDHHHSAHSAPAVVTPANFIELNIENIEVNSYNPRHHFDETALQELAESIKVQGIIQPITVRKLDDTKYQIISGERRYRASRLAGLTIIPAYIRTADDQQMLEMALIENIQRQDLNSVEVALSYQRLISECNLKQEELGDRVGKNRTTVNNYLRLLKLPPDVQAALRDNKITMGHARSLITIENIDLQLAILIRILKEELSVRQVEELVRSLATKAEKKPSEKKETGLSPEMFEVQQMLTNHFSTKISVKMEAGEKGEIKIPFMGNDDLNRILELLNLI